MIFDFCCPVEDGFKMTNEKSFKAHKEEVALLLQCLVKMRETRKLKHNINVMKKWAYALENEYLAPVIQDELYHVYRGLSTMAKANVFSSEELGIVHSILKICGLYDELEKL